MITLTMLCLSTFKKIQIYHLPLTHMLSNQISNYSFILFVLYIGLEKLKTAQQFACNGKITQ